MITLLWYRREWLFLLAFALLTFNAAVSLITAFIYSYELSAYIWPVALYVLLSPAALVSGCAKRHLSTKIIAGFPLASILLVLVFAMFGWLGVALALTYFSFALFVVPITSICAAIHIALQVKEPGIIRLGCSQQHHR
jgi:hypothetical protein